MTAASLGSLDLSGPYVRACGWSATSEAYSVASCGALRSPRMVAVIRRVIDERDVQVVYQPLVDLKTQKIFAYEALARSKSPDFDSPMSLFAAAVAENVHRRARPHDPRARARRAARRTRCSSTSIPPS